MKELQFDRLPVKIYDTQDEMGKGAAADIAACIKTMLQEKETINMIFAAAPSQNDVLRHLAADTTIPFERINAFHMDEYIGLKADAPQRFARYLEEHIFSLVPFRSVNYIACESDDIDAECARYSALLQENPVDIVCLGIGENGHIAFNDPHIALFDDPETVKKVELDEKCRMQQVNDGCFATLADVPQYALTLTIPTLCRASAMFCVVPNERKAEAVKTTCYGEIGEYCPATALRSHGGATLYLDERSAGLL